MNPVGSNTALCIHESSFLHHIIDGILDRVRHDLRLIDQSMMHGLMEHLLELNKVFSNGAMAWRREVGFLDYLALSVDHAECLETSIFEAINSLSQLLLLNVVEMLLSDLDDCLH